MLSSRRVILSALLGVVATGAAGCMGKRNRREHGRGLDMGRLARGFAPLATRARPGVLNLAVMSLDVSSVWCADSNSLFPMQDLFMAPLAAAALAEVDAGRLHLNDKLRIGPEDLSPPPSRLNLAGKPFLDVPVADLIALAVQQNDNTAADSLMRRIGGPGAVTAWLRAHDIQAMRVDRYEREIQPAIFGVESFRPAWKDDAAWAAARSSVSPEAREMATAAYLADIRDTTTAPAAVNFLARLASGALLSRPSTTLLLRLMTDSTTAPGRLRAGLPAGATLAHMSGSSATDLGLTPVTNDIGLVNLADGRRFAIAVLLAGSAATGPQRDGLIADCARLAVSAII
jgi:beta-lactamase class A